LTIGNNSDVVFRLDKDIKISGDNSSDFSLGYSKTNLLSKSKSLSIALISQPGSAGVKKAAVSVVLDNGKQYELLNLSGFALPEMQVIPAGVFQMGNNDSDFAMPSHMVYVSEFSLGKYEVTFELWNSVAKLALINGYLFANQGIQGKDGGSETNKNHPVTMINWFDAAAWCNALSELCGLKPVYFADKDFKKVYKDTAKNTDINALWNASGYRLPTEAEFEYAMRNRGKRSGFVYSGSENLHAVGWFIENARGTHQVGEKQPNEFMIYDMSGNVWEWCWDRFEKYTENIENDPKGSDAGFLRVIRGGAWATAAMNCEVSERGNYPPNISHFTIGFRIAKK